MQVSSSVNMSRVPDLMSSPASLVSQSSFLLPFTIYKGLEPRVGERGVTAFQVG